MADSTFLWTPSTTKGFGKIWELQYIFYIYINSLKAVNDMVNDKNALSVNHTQLNLAESKSHSGIRAECILHMAVSIGVID